MLQSPAKVEFAELWLKEVFERQKSGEPYEDSEWSEFCKQNGITQWTYNSAVNVLKDAGIVSKEKGEFKIDLNWIADVLRDWNNWLHAKHKEVDK